MKTILPFIQKRVVVLHEDSRLNQAARAMMEHGIGCVVVSDRSGHVTGIVTDRDLVRGALADSKNPESIPVSKVMTRDPVTVEENTTVQRVIELMEENGVRRVPVVHRVSRTTVKCIGIVTLDDLAMSRSIDPQHLMRVLRSQLKQKILPRSGKRKNGRGERKELSNFYKRVGEMVSPQLELNREELEQLSGAVLKTFVQRLHHTGALHLIGQLPDPLQTELLSLPSGPDSRMSSARLTEEVQEILETDHLRAYTAIVRFCSALEDWCEPRVLDHIKAQLPSDLQKLFAPKRSELATKQRAA